MSNVSNILLPGLLPTHSSTPRLFIATPRLPPPLPSLWFMRPCERTWLNESASKLSAVHRLVRYMIIAPKPALSSNGGIPSGNYVLFGVVKYGLGETEAQEISEHAWRPRPFSPPSPFPPSPLPPSSLNIAQADNPRRPEPFPCVNTCHLIKSYSTTRDRTLPPPVRRLGFRSHLSPAPAAAALRCSACHLRGRRHLSSSACCTFRMPPGWPHPRFCAYRTLSSRPQA